MKKSNQAPICWEAIKPERSRKAERRALIYRASEFLERERDWKSEYKEESRGDGKATTHYHIYKPIKDSSVHIGA